VVPPEAVSVVLLPLQIVVEAGEIVMVGVVLTVTNRVAEAVHEPVVPMTV
jgi:hypothetical protein